MAHYRLPHVMDHLSRTHTKMHTLENQVKSCLKKLTHESNEEIWSELALAMTEYDRMLRY